MALSILNALPDLIGKIIDRAIPDPTERAKMQIELAKLADAEFARASAERIAQTEVNKAEASSSSIFVAGWRPAAGWMSVGCVAYVIVVAPLFHLGVPAPENMNLVRDILLGMLGINVLARSVEKVKGVAENSLNPQASAKVPTVPEAPKKRKKILGVAVPPWL
jgi:hypothetical protein